MSETSQLTEGAIRALHEPMLTAKKLEELLGVNKGFIQTLAKNRILNPHDLHSSRVSQYSQRMYTLGMLKRAFQAMIIHERAGGQVAWRSLHHALTGLSDQGVFESDRWLEVLLRVNGSGYDGSALPRWEEVLKTEKSKFKPLVQAAKKILGRKQS
jgi:hypothetical protein